MGAILALIMQLSQSRNKLFFTQAYIVIYNYLVMNQWEQRRDT